MELTNLIPKCLFNLANVFRISPFFLQIFGIHVKLLKRFKKKNNFQEIRIVDMEMFPLLNRSVKIHYFNTKVCAYILSFACLYS